MPGNTCSNCIAFKYKCTYVETAAVRFIEQVYLRKYIAHILLVSLQKRVPDAGYRNPTQQYCNQAHLSMPQVYRESRDSACGDA